MWVYSNIGIIAVYDAKSEFRVLKLINNSVCYVVLGIFLWFFFRIS